MRRAKHKKRRKQVPADKLILLLTALINLVTAMINAINKLNE